MAYIPKKYIQDRVVLALLSVSIFLAFISSSLILLRLGAGSGGGYFVQYRSSITVGAFAAGGVLDVIGFLFFALITLVATATLSIRAYLARRELALIILGLGIMLLLMNTLVSNGLLRLH